MSNDRAKLETAIERQTHKLVSQIKEHVQDFTHLYVQRNKLNVDRDSMATVLEIMRLAIDDGFMKNVDRYMKELDGKLAEFTDEENPTQ